jgi:hypothetical protein
MSQFLWGKLMLNMLGSNVAMGQNVTVWEEERHETSGKNITEWTFCHNPGKNGWSNCHSYRTFHLETICHSGRSEPKDVELGGRSVGVKTLLGHSKRGRFVKAPYSILYTIYV